jgi:hypothetical protein
MLRVRPEPRINDKVQRILHLLNHTKTGDWYLYQDHTEIRVYGCELAPYKLPKYLLVRMFSLEYIRQMINSDHIHFVSLKKKATAQNQRADWVLHLQQSKYRGRSRQAAEGNEILHEFDMALRSMWDHLRDEDKKHKDLICP